MRTIQLLRGENNDLWIITVSTTILFVLVVIRMAGLVHKLELSFGREKALRTAGAVLVTATNRESIYSAAMQAVSPLTNQGRARLLVRLDETRDRYAVVAASHDGDGVLGAEIDIDAGEHHDLLVAPLRPCTKTCRRSRSCSTSPRRRRSCSRCRSSCVRS